jgi:phospholipid/cholesterol/gamma-HCH transport system substrate-binding protein
METEAHYFRVGMYIIVLALLAAFFAIWLANAGRGDMAYYRIYFSESVSGLTEGGPVKYRGVDVGKVDRIAIDPNDSRHIQVDVSIDKKAPVKTDTRAHLKMQGVTGAIFVELTGGDPRAESLRKVTPKDEVPVIPSEQGGIAAIVNQMPIILEKLSRFADQMNKLASDDNVKNFGGLIDNTSGLASDMREVVQGSKQDSKQMMMHLRKASRDINEVTTNVKENPSGLLFPAEEQGITPP